MEMLIASAMLLGSAFLLVTLVFWQTALHDNRLSRRGKRIEWEGDWLNRLGPLERVTDSLSDSAASEAPLTDGSPEKPTAVPAKHREPIAA